MEKEIVVTTPSPVVSTFDIKNAIGLRNIEKKDLIVQVLKKGNQISQKKFKFKNLA